MKRLDEVARISERETVLSKSFVRDHPPEFDTVSGTTRVGVAVMQMPPEPREHDFCEEYLMAQGAAVSAGLSLVGARSRVRKSARQALTADQQLADRFGGFELPPWRDRSGMWT